MAKSRKEKKKGKHIGELIKAARKRRKMKADLVGELCNVSRSRIYQWESSTFIKPKNFKALSQTLGISLKRLIAENNDDERV